MVPAAPTSASTSASVRKVQWSTLAAPSSTASRTPGPAESWLPCTRRPSPASRAGREHAAGLVLGEGVRRGRLAEDVDPAGVRRAGREHRPADEVEVGGAVVARLGRHDVGPEEGRLVGDLAGQPQRAHLVVDGQPVAALDLDGRRAERAHLGDARPQQGPQLVVARRAGGRHRDADAAAVVGDARHPGGELGRAVAGVDEVAVAVDEAGDDRAPIDVDDPVGRGCGVGRPDPGDQPVVRRRPRRRGAMPSRSAAEVVGRRSGSRRPVRRRSPARRCR